MFVRDLHAALQFKGSVKEARAFMKKLLEYGDNVDRLNRQYLESSYNKNNPAPLGEGNTNPELNN
jgi:hypothetical protein